MANAEPPPGLQPQDFTAQRNEAMREGVKVLLLMNGAGAVAMLAFLRTVWIDKPQLARYVVAGIVSLAGGVALAGLVQLFRYQASFSLQGNRQCAFRIYRGLYLTASYGSIAAFIVGVLIMALGFWCGLR